MKKFYCDDTFTSYNEFNNYRNCVFNLKIGTKVKTIKRACDTISELIVVGKTRFQTTNDNRAASDKHLLLSGDLTCKDKWPMFLYHRNHNTLITDYNLIYNIEQYGRYYKSFAQDILITEILEYAAK